MRCKSLITNGVWRKQTPPYRLDRTARTCLCQHAMNACLD
jgi:hypothetical protein